jgi:PPK2 family polyphosphate:nucleotide phosphotransferase
VLQAMDTAGKDGALHHVVGPLDSRGVHVVTFKAPNDEELAHDYLWRVHRWTPRRGEMTFFNRSHYEDVLAVRVFDLQPKSVWSRRYDHITAFEKMLGDEGTRVVKFFLHISKDEQKRRLQERLDDPDKRWKFDPSDLKARAKWDDFEAAYEDVLSRTSTEEAPWYVVPANRKWMRDLAVANVLVQVLEDMNPQIPTVNLDPSKIVIPD